MLIDTKKPTTFNKFIKKIYIPKQKSHKGENGKVLIIGGSKLFHSASIWAAEMASYIVDMVHYSSTQENNEIMISVKKKFLSGIVIDHKDIPKYVKEDDAILIGPGMVRGEKRNVEKDIDFKDILSIKDESHFARCLIYYLIRHYPKKQFVFDAGALQMMDKQWLLDLTTKPILTPHTIEFERLFGISLKDLAFEGKKKIVKKIAKEFNCVILYKGVKDIISDGDDIIVVEGGNSGLSKGGTGDVLASLCCSFSAKNDPILSAVISSILIKKTADKLFLKQGYWYNVTNLIEAISYTLKNLI
jgi:NAD(P)H-hydrate epimerase